MAKRILIVDDDLDARVVLSRLFGSEGYEVMTVDDGRSALQQIEQTLPDLIVTDLDMPRLDGMDLIRAIRARPAFSDIPIIVVSGSGDRSERIRGFDEGADDFMAKPVELGELLARANRQLRRHSQEQEHQRRSVADELTNVLNRRGIENFFARESVRCALTGMSLSVLFADLNEFKAINDSYGHVTGDVALCAVAQLLQESVRATDRVGRLGGDEFVVLMPSASAEVASEIAARIRSQFPIALPIGGDRSVPLTFSIGTAAWTFDESFQDLISRADADMYRDKRQHKTSLLPAADRGAQV